MYKNWKYLLTIFTVSLLASFLTLYVSQNLKASYGYLSSCSAQDIKIGKRACVTALQDSLNLKYLSCNAEKKLIDLSGTIDVSTYDAALQYSQSNGLEVTDDVFNQQVIESLIKDDSICLTPSISPLAKSEVSLLISSGVNEVTVSKPIAKSDSNTSSTGTKTDSSKPSSPSSSPSSGVGNTPKSNPVSSTGTTYNWVEVGNVYPELNDKRATVKIYACRKNSAIKTRFKVVSTSYDSSAKMAVDFTNAAYDIIYETSAQVVKAGSTYDSAESYTPSQSFHIGVVVSVGGDKSWAHYEKLYTVGGIGSCE